MDSFRLGKNTTERYTSFTDCAAAWGCKPVNKQTKDTSELEKQKENFCKRHICRNCGQPMTWMGGNQMVCTNEKCLGIKNERKNEETGEVRTWYTPSFDLLDEKGSEIAENIFA